MADDLDHSEPQAARILGVSPRTLQRWRLAGRIGHYRTPGGRIRYSIEQLVSFRASCRVLSSQVGA